MDKVKRLINCPIPVTACNFRCSYCYIGQADDFTGEIKLLPYPAEYIASLLSQARLGGPCHFSLCGMGETLLAPYVVGLAGALAQQGHYISIVTNGTITQRFVEICDFPKAVLEKIFIKFSFHYSELKRRGLFDVFFCNVERIKHAGCSFTVELTANDTCAPEINSIQNMCVSRLGAICHIVESRRIDSELSRLTKLPLDQHIAAWDTFCSPSFQIQKQTWGKKQTEFCYAGDWIIDLFLDTGDIRPCLNGGNLICNVYENVDEPIKFAAIGHNCPWAHCCSPYVTQASGVIPAIKAPTYAQMRNRVCSDRSEWLQPKMKAFFGSQFIESNAEYSDDKKVFIDAMMSLEYNNKCNFQSPNKISPVLEKHLSVKGIHTVAILGTERLGVWLRDLLADTSIRIKFIVPHEYSEKSNSWRSRLKYLIKYPVKRMLNRNEPLLLNMFDRWPQVDAVIVAPFAEYVKHKKNASNKAIKMLSILDLVE